MRINVFKFGGNSAEGGFVSNGLTLQGPLILSGPHTDHLHAVPKQYVDNAIYNLDADNITSGVLAAARLPAFTGDATTILGTSNLILANTGVTPGSIIKPTVDAKGRVVSGGTITEADITAISFDKVTTGRPTTLNGYGITDGVPLSSNTTITGDLIQSADPVMADQVATKHYVDAAAGLVDGISVGDIIRKPYTTTPAGFLKCNGGEVDKTTYANLYSVIGDNFNQNSIIGDNFNQNSIPGSGKPWRQQYQINMTQSTDISSWTTDTSLPGALAQSQAIVTKNRVYLLGGFNVPAFVSTVYTAPINSDGTLGSWTTGTPLPGALGLSQAIVTKNRVYLLGGRNAAAYLSIVYTAPINSDGTLGSWTTDTSLPDALAYSQAIVTKNRVYLLGGRNAAAYLSIVYTAPINSDGTLGSWTTDTSLPDALVASQAIVTKNRVYLLGGRNAAAYLSIVYTAPINSDGTLGSWTTDTSLPDALAYSQAIVTKNRVYLLGGRNAAAYLSIVYTAPINSDGTLGSWTTDTSLPDALVASQAIVTKNRVYLLGGENRAVYVSTVYTATFYGGMNDYSPYYDGTIEPVSLISTKFRLPDYTSLDKEFGEYVTSYIKY